ncbi:MAG: YibE/F family protein [Propionibacteriales bacterium]|nr:YibE/F family protein [Propionibacteriales bacterium]
MTPSHSHRARDGLGGSPPGVRIALACLLIPLVAATVFGVVVLWPSEAEVRAPQGFAVERAHGEITDLHRCDDPEAPPECVAASVRLSEGPDAPDTVEASLAFGDQAPTFEVGDRVVLGYRANAPMDERYSFIDFDRSRPLLLLAGLFVVGVLILSRLRGLGSLAGLGISLLVIIFFTLPALLAGTAPLAVATVTASAIMIVTLYLAHGLSARTSVALVGTLVALVLAGALGAVFTTVGHFTGYMDENVQFLSMFGGEIDMRGLLLAGLVIGALGVLDDVTVTQASAMWELAAANPYTSRPSLFAQGMRIGRAHVSSTVNTLVLAYVGASLPLMLLFAAAEVTFRDAVGTEMVGQEVVRALVGSLGIIAAVPVTTAIAAIVAGSMAGRVRRARQRAG